MSYIGTNKVGKMYLGDTAIGKAYLGEDLVYDSAGGGQAEPTYIQDNLVFHLDGINRGGTTGHWVDLIGGVDFTLIGCTEATDHVSFGGTGYGYTNTDLNYPFANYTMEIVLAPNFTTPSANCVVFMANGSSNVGFGYLTNAIITTAGSTTRKMIPISKPTDIIQFRITEGANYSAYINGVQTALLSGLNNWSIKGKPSIGCRMNGSSPENKFNGSIYSIRIYLGGFTDEQRLNNLAVDNERFNMGLTL